jgi:16S rRNA processing protein RimM
LRVGRVGRAVGLRGEVEIALETDNPDRFAEGARVHAEDGREFVVRTSRKHNQRTIVSFEGTDDRTGAEALHGTVLVIPDDDARELGPDEYWDHDLVGCTVVTVDGTEVGVVDDVVHQPSGALLSVGKHLIPLVSDIVKDVASGRITIDPIPGLLDG